MIRSLSFLIFFQVLFLVSGQVGINTSSPDPSSILEMNSNAAGVLIPRLEEADKANIATPIANGLLIFNTTEERFQYYFNGNWNNLEIEENCSYILSEEEFNINVEKGQTGSINLDILTSNGNPGTVDTQFSSATSNLIINNFNVAGNNSTLPANQTISFDIDNTSSALPGENGVVVLAINSNCTTRFVRINITLTGCDFNAVVDNDSQFTTVPVSGTNTLNFNFSIEQTGTTNGSINSIFTTNSFTGLQFNGSTGCTYPCNTAVSINVQPNASPGTYNYNLVVQSDCGTTQNVTLTVTIENNPRNCLQILQQGGSVGDGVYTIDPDGNGGIAPLSAYCDMTTPDPIPGGITGGWTLVLNYIHERNTDPNDQPRTTSLPVLLTPMPNINDAGIDQSNTIYWGHAATSLLGLFDFSEVRFYGESSSHTRVLHFKHNQSTMINYFKTGVGGVDLTELRNNFTPFPNHTANLPFNANQRSTNQGDNSMLNRPFNSSQGFDWRIDIGNDWEMDDNPNTQVNSTFHQVWIR